MKKILNISLILCLLIPQISKAGYRSVGRSSGYRSVGRSYHSPSRSYSRHTTVVRNSGGIGINGMVTGMLVGSALSHASHHGYYGHHGNGYGYNGEHYNNYVNGAIPNGYQVNLCANDKGLYDYAMRVCQDINCVNTYCFR